MHLSAVCALACSFGAPAASLQTATVSTTSSINFFPGEFGILLRTLQLQLNSAAQLQSSLSGRLRMNQPAHQA